MTEKLSLQQRLLNAQTELKAPKGQYNDYGKFKYRSAEDILEAVKPINANNGFTLTLSDEPVLVGDWHYIKATAEISDGIETKIVTAYAREALSKKGMDESQITGTASSYARKYALNGLYLIDDTKDVDTNEHRNQQVNAQSQQQLPQNKQNKITEPTKSEALIKAKELKRSIAQLKDVTQKQVEEWLLNYMEVSEVGLINDWNKAVIWLMKAENKAKEQQVEEKPNIPWGV